MPKISLVAPVYGVEKYIDTFLESIRNQTFQDFEAILVDDGSKDRCPEILDEFAKYDERIVVIHQENGGVSKARNTGLKRASGDYVYIVDSDDWLEPTALEVLWKAAAKTETDAVISDHYCWKDENRIYITAFGEGEFYSNDRGVLDAVQSASLAFSRNTLKKAPACVRNFRGIGAPWQHMYKRSLIEKYNLEYDTRLKGICDDILFNMQYYQFAESVAYTPVAIYNYRMVSGSMTKSYKPNLPDIYKNVFAILDDYISSINKKEILSTAYTTRSIIYLDRMMSSYFINPKNEKNEKERKMHFTRMMKRKPYSVCFRNVDFEELQSKKMKRICMLNKMKLYSIYWLLRSHGKLVVE